MRRNTLAGVLIPLLACSEDGEVQRTDPPEGYVAQPILEHSLVLPEGFSVSVYAERLNDVRMMTLGPGGELFASLSSPGRIVRLPDLDRDGVADEIVTVAQGLHDPHGLAFRGDTLYVAESSRVVRIDAPGRVPVVVVPDLPSGGGHHTRTLLIHEGYLYVSIGSSCNICDERDPRRAAVVRYGLDGGGERLFATGLRNAVGLAVHPESGEIWATNNDRDNLGDDLPPDRVNILREGGFYGWPQCYLPGRANPEYSDYDGCDRVIGPAVSLPAHVAPLGLAFYTGQMFPDEFLGDLFIALHGSWNRSVPVGYEVVRVDVVDGKPAGGTRPFVRGWLTGGRRLLSYGVGEAWGRPVDVLVAPDGALLISDDQGGRIFRVAFHGRR
ncbi:MAG TPA: PQQ-dependent sugar dehydrogenase [Gemmatimonadales bacterium]|nr:PQQ-dependent sugar dehydrogenase [Gemmatimonadales bacterium]